MFHERIKHIEVRHHFIRDIVCKGAVDVKKVSTYDNLGDMMTNIILVHKFRHYLDLIGAYNTY